MTDAIEIFNRAAQAELDAIETRRLFEKEVYKLKVAVLAKLNPGDKLPEWILQSVEDLAG